MNGSESSAQSSLRFVGFCLGWVITLSAKPNAPSESVGTGPAEVAAYLVRYLFMLFITPVLPRQRDSHQLASHPDFM